MNRDPLQFPLPSEPYRGIRPFRLLDWRIFFERDLEAEQIANLITLYRGVLLYGQSGSGKSSLINAGLLPAMLRRGRVPQRIRVFPEHGRELFIEPIFVAENRGLRLENQVKLPADDSAGSAYDRVRLSCDDFLNILRSQADLGSPLLIFDQFEELITLFEGASDKEGAVKDALAARAAIEKMICDDLMGDAAFPVKLLFAFRDDYFARLVPLFSRVPGLLDRAVGLALPRVESVERIIRGPFTLSAERGVPAGHFRNEKGEPDELDAAVANKLVEGMRAACPAGIVNLTEIQVICYTLWRRPELRSELAHATDPAAVLERILVLAARGSLNHFALLDRVRAAVLLSNLVTKTGTRDVVSEENLIGDTRRNVLMRVIRGDFKKVLNQLLTGTHLLRQSKTKENIYYEVASEFLISWIQELQKRVRRLVYMVWSYVTLAGVVFLIFFFGLTVFAYVQKHRAEEALRQKNEADARAAVSHAKAAESRAEVDRLRTSGDALVGLITSVESELNGALVKTGKAGLAADLQKQLTEYRSQYAAAVPKTGSWREALDAIRLEARKLVQTGDSAGALQLYIEGFNIATDGLAQSADRKSNDEMWLSTMLIAQGDILMTQGNLEQAKQRFVKARDFIQQNKATFPGSDWEREFGAVYGRIGDLLDYQGDATGALQNYRERLSISEKLNKEDPNNWLWQHDVTWSTNRIGDVLFKQGDLPAALKSFRAGLVMAEKMSNKDPANRPSQSAVAWSKIRLGELCFFQGNLTEALNNFKEALAIAEKLTKEEPKNVLWERDLASIRTQIGDALRKQGYFEEALQHYSDSFMVAQKLAKQDANNSKWQSDLAWRYQRIGNVARELGDIAKALANYESGLAIRQKLATQNPDNFIWQHNLAESYESIGNVFRDKGDPAGALRNFRDGLMIRERLAKHDPNNRLWQDDLSSVHRAVGNALRDQGDLSAALESYGRNHVIRQALVAHDPTNATWQNSLANSFEKLGAVFRDQGKFEDAIQNFRTGLEIAEKLVKQDPTNVKWQADLAHLYSGLAITLGKMTSPDKEQARGTLEKATNMFRQLRDRKALTAEQLKWLEEAEVARKRFENPKSP